jgi:hypothetical protein
MHWLGGRWAIRAALLVIVAGLAGLGVALMLGSVPLLAVAFVVAGAGIGALDVMINVEGSAVERIAGRTLLPMMHAAWSVGVAVGAGIGAACAAAGITPAGQFIGEAVLIAVAAFAIVAGIPPGNRASTGQPSIEQRARLRRWLRGWLDWRLLLIGLVMLGAELGEGAANNWLPWRRATITDNLPRSPPCSSPLSPSARRCPGPSADMWSIVSAGSGPSASPPPSVSWGWRCSSWSATAGSSSSARCWAIGVSLSFPLGASAAAQSGPDAAARVSIVASIGYFANLAGPPAIGALAQSVGLLHALWLLAALFAVAFAAAGCLRPNR